MSSTTLQFNLAKANSASAVAGETDFQVIVYTVTSTEAPAQNQGPVLLENIPHWGRTSRESIPVRTPCVLQRGSEALLSSMESSWCRERWELSPSKAEWQLSLTDFEEGQVLNFEDLGNPALIKEHTAELQFQSTSKP